MSLDNSLYFNGSSYSWDNSKITQFVDPNSLFKNSGVVTSEE